MSSSGVGEADILVIEFAGFSVRARLLDTPTAAAFRQKVPFTSTVNRWGEEIYFRTSVTVKIEPGARRGPDPRGAAARQLRIAHFEVQPAARRVELDRVAVAHQGDRAARGCFGRSVQDAGTVTRAAHPAVGDPHHVAHAALEQL